LQYQVRMRVPIAFATLALLCACGAPAGYSGTVQTESVTVGSQTGGRVVQVGVSAGSVVHPGSIVLRLDSALLQAQYAQAVAQEQAAAARLAELEHGNVATDVASAQAQSAAAQAQYRQVVAATTPEIRAQAAAVHDAQANVVLAQATYRRLRSLAATGDVSQQSLDQARASYGVSQAKLAQAKAQYNNLVAAQLPGQRAASRQTARALSAKYQTVANGARPEVIAAARAQLAEAKAAAEHAQVLLRETVVRSPVAGAVSSFDLHPGDLLNPNQPAAIIDSFADPYVYIYASQRDLAGFPDGKHVKVTSDSGAGTFEGVVETHDRSAQFTPQNVETADQRAELVYGVKIRIHDPHHELLDGTTVTVYPQ
jgi:multidrug resistance efflux pump